MSEQRKGERTPEEILHAIEEADADDEAERVLALSDEQIDQELAEAGVDPERVRARGREIGERLTGAAHPANLSPPAPLSVNGGGDPPFGEDTPSPHGERGTGAEVSSLPRKKTRRAPWVALLAASLAAVGVALIPLGDMVGTGRPTSDVEKAAALRAKAGAECASQKWKECLGDLDAAKVLDPTGEDEPIQRARRSAESALRGGR